MRSAAFDVPEFLAGFQLVQSEQKSVEDLAKLLGITPRQAIYRANFLRRKGISLPRLKRKDFGRIKDVRRAARIAHHVSDEVQLIAPVSKVVHPVGYRFTFTVSSDNA